MMTRKCLNAFLLLNLLALLACGETRFENDPVVRKGESQAIKEGTSKKGSSSETSHVSKEAEVKPKTDEKAESLPVSSDMNIIPSEPAVGPSVIAGASLTCIRISHSKRNIDCDVTVEKVRIDAVPDRIYVKDEVSNFWFETDFKRVHVGRYKLSLPVDMPESFPVALTYGNNQAIYGTVE